MSATTDFPGIEAPAAWWAPGLALHERGDLPDGGPAEPDPVFALRLTDLGMPLTVRLTETNAELAARVPQPAWARLAERAISTARPLDAEPADWQSAFARILAPFAEDVTAQIRGSVTEDVDLAQVADGITVGLGRRLVAIAVRTLVTELHRWRTSGRLDGEDGQARFNDFVRRLTRPAGLAEVFTRYPVLARLLAQATQATATATVELLDRFAQDRAALVENLLDGIDPGRVTRVLDARGDQHAGGRSVAVFEFADGRRVVYKPHDVTAAVRFAGFLDCLADDDLFPRTPKTMACAGYGWSEYISAEPLADRAAADRFYHRQGALLALLHAVRATDMHYENLIAHGDQPIPVDLETLFQPSLAPAGSGDPAADALNASVHRTALLPLKFVGEQGVADMSGLGGEQGDSPASAVHWLDAGTDLMRLTRRPAELAGAANRPMLDGKPVDPAAHEHAMLAGFRQAYDAITEHAEKLTDLVRDCASLHVRVVTRPTWVFGTLLDETTHPDVLRDALDRDRALAVLYPGRTGHPLFAQQLRHEIADLWAGDVPMFTACVGTGRLRTSRGVDLPQPLPQTGLSATLSTLSELGEVDRRDQEWVIAATMATRAPSPAHPQAGPVSGDPQGAGAHPDELLAAACGVADQIVARGITGGGRVTWLGLEAVEAQHWLVTPMGASLGSGYLGVAVFLAQLAKVTGLARYADQARAAVTAAPGFITALAQRPDLVAAIGCGGLHGLGGIAYGLARLGALLEEPRLTELAAATVPLAAAAATENAEPGWAGGLAGCLAAMTAVHADLGLDTASATARHCAGLLTQGVHNGPSGFLDGLAGIAWALGTLGPGEDHRIVGRRLARAGDATSPGWCNGAAGLALAQTLLPASVRPDAIEAFADGPVRRDLSLCHGELGLAEVLTVLTGTDRQTDAARALRRRTGLLLTVLRRHGPLCGVPGEVPTPGLLTGLAGIGYGLLRLAAPQQVPSVLLLHQTTA
ncbi:type 2 lanthipeptide synthetase LanM family protein [Actinocrispum sp. NPDC049592]|uniref:type 2 lanthipeptide synthetase LanM family protein n=1 Tax=Actinocrispum sp. NPDC049592 TaxID=3154835 RepID=UPI003434F693